MKTMAPKINISVSETIKRNVEKVASFYGRAIFFLPGLIFGEELRFVSPHNKDMPLDKVFEQRIDFDACR